MLKSKNARVSSLSIIGRSFKLLSAPITLLIISGKLTSSELAFYYTFFSLVSMQQLAELGIGHTMKQYISHSYTKKSGCWEYQSKKEIKGYYKLTSIWFNFVGLFIFFVVGVLGFYYLDQANSNVNWQGPWFSLIVVATLATQITPLSILLDSTQEQESVQKANLYTSIIGSVTLWYCLYLNLGLYSISISLFFSSFSLAILLRKSYLNKKEKLNDVMVNIDINDIFKKVIPLLSKVSIVWGLGFLFWNSFNLISFHMLDNVTAGKIIFCIALSRAGFGIAESIIQSQTTIFSNLIGLRKKNEAISIFNRYFKYSMFILVIGYLFFFAIWFLIPDLYLFQKLPDKLMMIQVCFFFVVLLYKTLNNNFIRCFKIEPFVITATIESISLPILFLFGIKYCYSYFMLPSILMMIIMTIITILIGRRRINKLL